MEKINLQSVKIALNRDEMEEIVGGSATGGGCTGSNVLGCFLDVYSGHGWASLAAGVTTGFFPQTGVVFAAACAAKNGC